MEEITRQVNACTYILHIFMKARYTLSLVAFMCHPENGDQEIAKSLATPEYPQQLGV